ncbi:MAG: hypothetical protein Pg6B_03020 [Candidatus Azobacteroides pseudotrichonymphae]|uniref:hypothetical protein n=1 Tax=Candidatus Azobacteroides pseudotrichonymphae TaxID=511435 RepID=UPI0005A00C47|nr:hypothetical protein [Candidatus Azobacteroides pseudotrichonymphae]GMO33186.1 MAG: hypothetical protein Pg6B_03020 [Candidatus Azobacteroides pseudotrichonymphae]
MRFPVTVVTGKIRLDKSEAIYLIRIFKIAKSNTNIMEDPIIALSDIGGIDGIDKLRAVILFNV